MRARIDITEIEAQTKIRAKYLRALENEEWDLLPGPTYVKTFLRTYADGAGPRRAAARRGVQAAPRAPVGRRAPADLARAAPRARARARSRRGRPALGLVALVHRGTRRSRSTRSAGARTTTASPTGSGDRPRRPTRDVDEHDAARKTAPAQRPKPACAADRADGAGRRVRPGGRRAKPVTRPHARGRAVHRTVPRRAFPDRPRQRRGAAAGRTAGRARSRRRRPDRLRDHAAVALTAAERLRAAACEA